MSDNTQINIGSGGDTVRTVDRTSGGIAAKAQVVLLDVGGEQAEGLVSLSNPVPVAIQADTTQSSDASDYVAIVGDPNGDFAGVNLIEQVVTDGSGLAFNVKVLNPPKLDAQGAAIASDAVQVPIPYLPIGAYATIDTTGYQSFTITTQALAGGVTGSNDGITWSAIYGVLVSSFSPVNTIVAVSGYQFGVSLRYVRITATTAGTATVYLRAAPCANFAVAAGSNLQQIGSTAIVTGGVAGIISVGGNIAPGTARTANPVPMGGVDSKNLTRTFLTDTSGRIVVNDDGTDTFGNSTPLLTDAFGAAYHAPTNTNNAQINLSELLTQLVAIERVNSLLLYQILQTMGAAFQIPTSTDEPEDLIADYLNPAADGSMPYLKN